VVDINQQQGLLIMNKKYLLVFILTSLAASSAVDSYAWSWEDAKNYWWTSKKDENPQQASPEKQQQISSENASEKRGKIGRAWDYVARIPGKIVKYLPFTEARQERQKLLDLCLQGEGYLEDECKNLTNFLYPVYERVRNGMRSCNRNNQSNGTIPQDFGGLLECIGKELDKGYQLLNINKHSALKKNKDSDMSMAMWKVVERLFLLLNLEKCEQLGTFCKQSHPEKIEECNAAAKNYSDALTSSELDSKKYINKISQDYGALTSLIKGK